MEENDLVIYASSDDGDNVTFQYASVKNVEEGVLTIVPPNTPDPGTTDPISVRILKELVTPVLFVVSIDGAGFSVRDCESGDVCTIEALTDPKCNHIKKLVDADSMCIMIVFSTESHNKRFYEAIAERCSNPILHRRSNEARSSRAATKNTVAEREEDTTQKSNGTETPEGVANTASDIISTVKKRLQEESARHVERETKIRKLSDDKAELEQLIATLKETRREQSTALEKTEASLLEAEDKFVGIHDTIAEMEGSVSANGGANLSLRAQLRELLDTRFESHGSNYSKC